MKGWEKTYGYYHATITSQEHQPLLHSNDERAFIIASLQDSLSPRMYLGEPPVHQQLASCIDLLAFSIRSEAVHLVFFAIDKPIARAFIESIKTRLHAYQSEFSIQRFHARRPSSTSVVKKLRGPHHALEETASLHLFHEDWEYDRYSSIGFYLHDRRGDWMRTWRMSQLYKNNPETYRQFLEAHVNVEAITLEFLAS